ncbi:Protein tyrosine phosphatase type IVA 1 [Tyrophagus putrescentiae]|nr:Protein tyrosine phosphatase type IVA 1 [Tyrophagus putrescentiae]
MSAAATSSHGGHHNHHNMHPTSGSRPEIIMITGRCGPSLVTYKNLRFLITDKPTDPTLTQYIEELQRRKVTDVVRVCESTYSAKRLEQAGIQCHDWAFDDGTPPPPAIITDWLNLIIERFKQQPGSPGTRSGNSSPTTGGGVANGAAVVANGNENVGPCIAVHCVAGLGRAPVLVAIALIEAGMKYEDAVEMIRDVRRGAINAKQLQYLSQYKPKKVLLPVIKSKGSQGKGFCCIV